MLPDIDQQDWDTYQQQNLQQQIQAKIDSFGLDRMIGDKISELNALNAPPLAPKPEPPPAPEPEPPTPAPEAPSVSTPPEEPTAPPPITSPTLTPDFQNSAPVLQAPAGAPPQARTSIPPPLPSTAPAPAPPAPTPSFTPPPPSRDDWFGNALNAVQASGGDVQSFAQSYLSASGPDSYGNALNAAQNAGADVQQFSTAVAPPPPPPTPPAAQPASLPGVSSAASQGATSVSGVPDWLSSLIAQNAPAELASDPDFIRTVAAGAKAESGWDPNRIQNGFTLGSNAGARGLFQFDMGGMGAGMDEQALLGDQGAAYQASKIVPLYAKAYMSAPQGLSGADKASWVAGQAERPLGFTDPASAARRNYASAYNEIGAGPGATPQDLLARTGGWAQQAANAPQISQFGDKQLSADEAYAACGPAAAVRFAQMYGRNPSLREATDLAASVGWTSAQGMAGLGSEKALMDKLGVPTHVVGGDWNAIASEASTGNPVTISTPGHYFFADGYDPNSGAFHVGQSGLDLKGGSEWMTPQQMEGRMGALQGALFADNPRVPAPSTADQTSAPQSFLGRVKDTIGASFSGLGSTTRDIGRALGIDTSSDPTVQALDQAVTTSAQPPDTGFRRVAPGMVGGPPDYTDFGKAAALSGDQNLGDALGKTAYGALEAFGKSLPDVSDMPGFQAPPANTPLGKVVRGTPISQLPPAEQAQAVMQWRQQAAQASEEATQAINPARDVPLLGGLINQSTNPENWLAMGGAGRAARAVEGLAGTGIAAKLAGAATEGGLLGAQLASQQPGATAEDIALGAASGTALGTAIPGAGYAVKEGAPRVASAALGALDRLSPPDVAYASTRRPMPTDETPYSAQSLMDAYDNVTPARIASINQRVVDNLAPRLAGARGDIDAANALIQQVWDYGKSMLDQSRMTTTGLSAKAAAALADGQGFTNKLNMAGTALDSAEATMRQVTTTDRPLSIEDALNFVQREAHADNMALGSTQALDEAGIRDPDALNRLYAYTTAGPPLQTPFDPAVHIVWEDGAPRVVTAHHHYGIGSPDADIHASTSPGIKDLMWNPDAVAGGVRTPGPGGEDLVSDYNRIPVGDGRTIADTDTLVGPSGENDMRMATVLAGMPKTVADAIRQGKLTDPEQIAGILLREAVPQRIGVVQGMFKRMIAPEGLSSKEISQMKLSDVAKEALAMGATDNGMRTESLMVDPQLQHIKALYLAGTEGGIRNADNLANVGRRTQLELAQQIRQRIMDETGKDVPIIFKDIQPQLAGGEASIPSKLISDAQTLAGPSDVTLAPGRQRIIDAYRSAGMRDIGSAQTAFASRLGGGLGGAGLGWMTAPDDASPQDRVARAAAFAAAGLGGAYGIERLAGRLDREAPDAYKSVIPEAFKPPDLPDAPGLGQQIKSAWDSVNRQFFDRNVDLANYDKQTSYLARLASDPAAEVRVQQGLRPAVQSVGDDYNALRDLVTLRHNVRVADQVGEDLMRNQADGQISKVLRDNRTRAEGALNDRKQELQNAIQMNLPKKAIDSAQRAVDRAQKSFDLHDGRVQDAYNEVLKNASRSGAEAAASRMFSGGIDKATSLKRIQDLEDQLPPDRWQNVKDAADQVSQFGQSLRQRLVDAGVMSQDQASEMEMKYPDWVKTKILDYMNSTEGGQAAGSKIGLSSRDVHAYTQAGTERAREDPIASMVAYAHQVERMARKNEAFQSLLDVDAASGQPQFRQVPQDFKPTSQQETIQGFVDGVKQKFVTDNKALGQAINQTGVTQLPDWAQTWGRMFRSLATSRNPVFLAGNAALDIPEYALRSAVREGGPQHIPRVLGELAKGYADAFQGITRGEYAGEGAQRYLLGGGGESGAFSAPGGTAADIAKRGEELARELGQKHVWSVNSSEDLGRLLRNLATLKPVESLGERVELGPRIAAMRLAEKRGLDPVQSVIQGRDVTIDFNQGGQFTKLVNQMVPFFNVGFQGPAQVARSFGENKGAFASTVGSLIGLPAISSEIWNNRDDQTARDYADVPQYVKDQGLVYMLPGEAPVDAQGNRHPQYAHINLRNWAPFAGIARQAVDHAMNYPGQQDMRELAYSTFAGLNPFGAAQPANLMQRAVQGIPALSAAAQINMNRDIFRNRYIVSQRADQQASQLAKDLTPAIQKVTDLVAPGNTTRPSAVDFALRDQLAGVGGAALSAYDMLRGAPGNERAAGVGATPVVGGLAGRFVGGSGGELLQQYQQQGLSDETSQALRDAGVTYAPSPLQQTLRNIPLQYDEQVYAQALANQYMDQQIQQLMASSAWQGASQAQRDQFVQTAASRGRAQAENEVLSAMGAQERDRRLAAAGRGS